MTRIERKILTPLIALLRKSDVAAWSTLKEQTQFGPAFIEFPYYPAALEFEAMAIALVADLQVGAQRQLVTEWRQQPRAFPLADDAAIIRQYGLVLLNAFVRVAQQAAARTIS